MAGVSNSVQAENANFNDCLQYFDLEADFHKRWYQKSSEHARAHAWASQNQTPLGPYFSPAESDMESQNAMPSQLQGARRLEGSQFRNRTSRHEKVFAGPLGANVAHSKTRGL